MVCETEHEDPPRVGHGPSQNEYTAGQAIPLQVSQLELEWCAGSLEFNLASDAEIFILTLLSHTYIGCQYFCTLFVSSFLLFDPLQLIIEHVGNLVPAVPCHGHVHVSHLHHDASQGDQRHGFTLCNLIVGCTLSFPTFAAGLEMTLFPATVTIFGRFWARYLHFSRVGGVASSVTISTELGFGGCVGVGIFPIRLDCGHLGILYTNFQFWQPSHFPCLPRPRQFPPGSCHSC